LGHLNVNTLSNKFDEFKSFLARYKFHVFTLNETKLPKKYLRSSFEIEGYEWFQYDRKGKNGGGSAIYVRKDCISQEYHFTTVFPKYVEVHIVRVKIPYTKPYLVINIYNPPDVKELEFINCLNKLLVELSAFTGNLVILGDLNIN